MVGIPKSLFAKLVRLHFIIVQKRQVIFRRASSLCKRRRILISFCLKID
jgi:hypothetical protein